MEPETAQPVNSNPARFLTGIKLFWVVVLAILFAAQVGVVTLLGTRMPGPALADGIYLVMYLLAAFALVQAGKRSNALARYVWFIAAFAAILFCVGELCDLYAELVPESPRIATLGDVFSVFWFGPVSLTLFLEPDFELRRFDKIHILDFIQVVLSWIVIYFFFLYMPTREISNSPFVHSWLRATWAGSLVYDGLMAATFLLRSALTNSPVIRALFGRIGLFLVFVVAGDFYYNYLGATLQTGSWYEIVWTLLGIAPIVLAVTWDETTLANTGSLPSGHDRARNRLFPTLFALLVLLLSFNLVRLHTTVAFIIVTISFACSSLRLIVVQQRQERVQSDLRAEIIERERVEQQLREHEEHLEEQVAERTARLEESRAQLRQAQKMEAIGQLAGGVAHDFNNLLTVIRGYGQLIVEKAGDPQLRSSAERIDEAAARASSLTSQLLAFSRRQVLQPKVFNLNALVQNLEKMLRRLIGEDVEMATVLGEDVGSIRADHGQIEQVILNLVVNARDAMPKGGKLTLETSAAQLDVDYVRHHPTSEAGRHVLLAVSDTGVGIAPENLSRIFEPFFTTKGLGRGTGLGLSMAYGIVKQSGGNIWVYSEPGKGTSFKIYLPVVDAPAEAIPSEKQRMANMRGNETILLVEDDQQVRELARTILVECGYSVLTAEKPVEASSLCRNFSGQIHLMLTDVVMPGLSGRDLAVQVSALRPQIKVLYMSGYTTNAIVHHGELDADTAFLPKPFTPMSLSVKVREVLDQDRPGEP